MPGHGSFSAGMPELSLTSCDDVLDPTRDSTYTFLGDFLEEMTTVFTDSLIYLGGDEVGFDPKCKWPGSRVCGYHCFDKDPSVAAWMKTQGSVFCACLLFVLRRREGPHKTLDSLYCLTRGLHSNRMNSTQLLDHFWKQVTLKVVPRIQGHGNRTVGVWMADRCVASLSAGALSALCGPSTDRVGLQAERSRWAGARLAAPAHG